MSIHDRVHMDLSELINKGIKAVNEAIEDL